MSEQNKFPSFETVGTGMNLWFEEQMERKSSSNLRIKIRQTLWTETSEFQRIAVLETWGMGRMLVLDGIIMVTEFDESGYHEMISHPALLTHPNPKNVLVIGGGDGGTVREAVKHPGVEKVHLCEIDQRVVEVCKEFMPGIASGLKDPRVECFYEDGAAFVRNRPNTYDVILVDSSDPIGPAEVLFKEQFFRDLHASLKPDGIVVTQCESYFYHTDFIADILSSVMKIYPVCGYYSTTVPTYPSGVIGFSYCSRKPHPLDDLDVERAAKLPDLNYYSPALHNKAFVLPEFVRRKLPRGLANDALY